MNGSKIIKKRSTQHFVFNALVFMCLSSQCPTSALAKSPFLLEPGQPIYSMGMEAAYLEDPSGTLSMRQALSTFREGGFTKSDMETPSFGFTTSVYWLAVEVMIPMSAPADWLFQVAYPALDLLEVDIFQGEVKVESYKVGDTQPFNQRVIHNRNFLFPLTLEKNTSTLVLLRAQQFDGDLVELPVAMLEAANLSNIETSSLLVDGIYIGIMLVMGIYHLILFLLLRDKAYLFYVGYVFSILLLMAALRGWGYQFLWPDHPSWQQACFPFLVFITALFVIEFSGRLLSLQTTLPTVFIFMRVLLLTLGVAAVLTSPIPYWFTYGIVMISAACIGMSVLFASGLYLWVRGSETARYYCVAFSSFILGSFIFSASKVGLLTSSIWSDHAIQIGGAIEVCLFSLALAARIKILESENQANLEELARESASHAQDIEQFNQSLSTKLFLFGDIAHQVNNPLNVAQGGTEVARNTLDSFTKTVLGFFPAPHDRTIEEQKVVDHLESLALKIGLSLEDSKVELSRAVAYVEDLRVLGGVDGESPDSLLLTAAVDKAMERITADLGPKKNLMQSSPERFSKQTIIGQSAVLAVALSAWFKHAFLRQAESEPLVLSTESSNCGLYCWLRVSNQSNTVFVEELTETLSSRDVVMGLVGRQGAEWSENRNAKSEIESFSLRIAASEDAWIRFQGGSDRK